MDLAPPRQQLTAAAPRKRPLISANQVTFARLALIPLPCWLMYQGSEARLWAVVLGTLIGCTDFVDGYLARKHGPTVLGGLMDPIADKVFMAITFLPAVDQGWVPAWLVGAIFMREFLVTALRTAYERRELSLKSSYLARYKTWVQMCGIGVLLLLNLLPRELSGAVLATLAGLPILAYLARLIIARKRWRGASAFAVSFSVLFLAHRSFGPRGTSVGLMYFILAITWWTGLSYLLGVGKLRGRGAVSMGDVLRVLTSIALPCLLVAAQARPELPTWPIIALASIELAHGGLDNLLAHHRAEAGPLEWGGRLLGECGLLGYALLSNGPAREAATVAACAVAVLGLTVAAVQKRRYYLDGPSPGAPAPAVPPAVGRA